MNIQEAYRVMQKASGIKVGDTVKILRSAKSYEMGWYCSSDGAPTPVGTTAKVIGLELEPNRGVILDICGGTAFPFFVLEKIEDAKPETVDDVLKRSDFGCQNENVKALVSAIIKECKG